MPDVSGALTRKIGPLPAWGWGVAVGGAALGVKMMKGGGGGGVDKTVIEVPTGAPYPADELTSQIGEALLELRERVDDIADGTTRIPGPATPPVTSNPPASKPPVKLPTAPVGKITTERAQALLKAWGAPTTWATSAYAKSHPYIFNSADSFKAWVWRNAANPASGYKVLSGRIVPRTGSTISMTATGR